MERWISNKTTSRISLTIKNLIDQIKELVLKFTIEFEINEEDRSISFSLNEIEERHVLLKKQVVNDKDELNLNESSSDISVMSSIKTQDIQNITYIEEHYDLLTGNTKQNIMKILEIIDKLTLNEDAQGKINKLTGLHNELVIKINKENQITNTIIQTKSQKFN